VNAITVSGLTRDFGSFRAVDGVSFEVEKGEIFGYLGANGAGKTTTIRMLCGLLPPSGGDAIVAGHAISGRAEEVKQAIGYMSQKFSLYAELRVRENLEFFGGAYGLWGKGLARRIDAVLELVDLAGRDDALTGDLPGACASAWPSPARSSTSPRSCSSTSPPPAWTPRRSATSGA
jgi:ABC-2 type transport system ATP-binding protein